MNVKVSNSKRRSLRGILLVECLVYLSVLVILLGIGTAVFYMMWDNATALRSRADEISAALRAGEAWRADVRDATGMIEARNTTNGVLLRIPRGKNEIVYRFAGNQVL